MERCGAADVLTRCSSTPAPIVGGRIHIFLSPNQLYGDRQRQLMSFARRFPSACPSSLPSSLPPFLLPSLPPSLFSPFLSLRHKTNHILQNNVQQTGGQCQPRHCCAHTTSVGPIHPFSQAARLDCDDSEVREGGREGGERERDDRYVSGLHLSHQHALLFISSPGTAGV